MPSLHQKAKINDMTGKVIIIKLVLTKALLFWLMKSVASYFTFAMEIKKMEHTV